MTTVMQKNAADNMIKQEIETKNVNKKKALIEAGYSEKTAGIPKIVTESKGFVEYMEKHGINRDSLAGMLSEDLRLKVGNRLGEIKLSLDMLGETTNKVNIDVSNKREIELLTQIIDGKGDEANGES